MDYFAGASYYREALKSRKADKKTKNFLITKLIDNLGFDLVQSTMIFLTIQHLSHESVTGMIHMNRNIKQKFVSEIICSSDSKYYYMGLYIRRLLSSFW